MIAQVSTSSSGGAGLACRRLHTGLLEGGVESGLLLNKCSIKRDSHIEVYERTENQQPSMPELSLKSWINEKINRTYSKDYKNFVTLMEEMKLRNGFVSSRDSRLEMFSFPSANYDITKSWIYQNAELINLHWVADFLDYETFFNFNTKPVVWTLHDMNPFSGGEHYIQQQILSKDGNHIVERHYSDAELEHNDTIKAFKSSLYDRVAPFDIVAPSQWIAKEAIDSNVFNENSRVHVIPNGVSIDTFRYRYKKDACRILDLPDDRPIILIVADSLKNSRKGIKLLNETFSDNFLHHINPLLCLCGKNGNDLFDKRGAVDFGEIKDDRLLNIIYCAVDVVVIPSLQDNLPNVALEAICSGTPVVGFAVGGMPEIVEHGVNGLLSQSLDIDGLREMLSLFFNHSDFVRDQIARKASLKYSSGKLVKEYTKLYESILQSEIRTVDFDT